MLSFEYFSHSHNNWDISHDSNIPFQDLHISCILFVLIIKLSPCMHLQFNYSFNTKFCFSLWLMDKNLTFLTSHRAWFSWHFQCRHLDTRHFSSLHFMCFPLVKEAISLVFKLSPRISSTTTRRKRRMLRVHFSIGGTWALWLVQLLQCLYQYIFR